MNPILNNEQGTPEAPESPSLSSTSYAIEAGLKIKEEAVQVGIKQELLEEDEVANVKFNDDEMSPPNIFSKVVQMAQLNFLQPMMEFDLNLVTTSQILPNRSPMVHHWTPPRLYLRFVQHARQISLIKKDATGQDIQGSTMLMFTRGGGNDFWPPSCPNIGSPASLVIKVDDVLYNIVFKRKVDRASAFAYFHAVMV